MIRQAKNDDLESLLVIYNEGIMKGTASFEERPLTDEEGKQWFADHQGRFPILIFEEKSHIQGYVTISPYGHERETAYCSVELSIYIDERARGKGVGGKLLKAMIERVRQDKRIKTIISVITEGNEGSVRLHEKNGFVLNGRLKNVAKKHGQLLNILFYQKLV